MAALTTRQKLISYLADADEAMVSALFTLLEREMQEDVSFSLTNEHLDLLQHEQALHNIGQSKSCARQEATDIIRGERNF